MNFLKKLNIFCSYFNINFYSIFLSKLQFSTFSGSSKIIWNNPSRHIDLSVVKLGNRDFLRNLHKFGIKTYLNFLFSFCWIQ